MAIKKSIKKQKPLGPQPDGSYRMRMTIRTRDNRKWYRVLINKLRWGCHNG